MGSDFLYAIAQRKLPPGIGAKAENLRFLRRKGFRTPETFVVPWDAHERFRQGDTSVVDSLRAELAEALDDLQPYAIRSSADVEDAADYSFAGQFATLLNVAGTDDVVSAILRIWDSAAHVGVSAYRERTGRGSGVLSMAVIIQKMVRPRVSGVSFSVNPVTGMDETIVEAVRGSGEALVQEGVTPQRWVQKWGTWIVAPTPGLEAVEEEEEIPRPLIAQVVAETRRIAKAYRRPVDLEWVWDGQDLYWVQLRAITSLDIPVYSNRISREVFPGLIKPLVWSVNVPLVNGAWVRLFTELIGPNDLDPQDLARSFYYRAYFNMSALGEVFELLGMPRETLELMLGLDVEGPDKPSFRPSPKTLSLVPRMLIFALRKIRFERRVDPFLTRMQEQFEDMAAAVAAHSSASASATNAQPLSESDLLEKVDRLTQLAQETAYYNIVVPLLMHAYNRLLRTQLTRAGMDGADLDSFDVAHDMEELRQFDPSMHLAQLRQRFGQLDPALQQQLRTSTYRELREMTGQGAAAQTGAPLDLLQAEFQRFLDRFGHLSDSGNDFSSTPWREKPDVILRMVTDQPPAGSAPVRRKAYADLPLSGWRRMLLRPVYRRARRFRRYREAVSSLYTLGYGLFRPTFLALGQRFVERGLLGDREDILYLQLDEVRHAVHDDSVGLDFRRKAQQRREEMARARDVTPPSIIYGDEPLPLEGHTPGTLRGVPTSRGHYCGPAKVVKGLEDFDKLEDGDVLVIPFSDVGWTPLFARAGAVVAESGGLLSHSSIVAREYGIPAVVSVPQATSLSDGTLVTVDGYRGEIGIHKSTPAATVEGGLVLPAGSASVC